MNKVHIDFHHSQIPDPPDDIVDATMMQFEFESREICIVALKGWKIAADLNKWTGESPDYLTRWAMFMSGFTAGWNCHDARIKAQNIAKSN